MSGKGSGRRLSTCAVLGLMLLGCAGGRGCLGRDGAAAAGGDTPYVRCLTGSPPPEGTRHLGRLTLQIAGRSLRIQGLTRPLTLAAFSGPGAGDPPGPTELAALRAAAPDLLLLLGDIGDTPPQARATLAVLAALPQPTLLVAGGRDTPARITSALEALGKASDRIIDATTLREIRIGSDTLVPVAGAEDGRYALDAHACGYDLGDLKRLSSELTDKGSRRWLIAWQAPGLGGPHDVARTQHGVDTGSRSLAQLATRIGAPGGIFAWPHVALLRPSMGAGARLATAGVAAPDLRIVVPRLSGPALERSDGSRVLPGFALLRLDAAGLRLQQDATASR